MPLTRKDLYRFSIEVHQDWALLTVAAVFKAETGLPLHQCPCEAGVLEKPYEVLDRYSFCSVG